MCIFLTETHTFQSQGIRSWFLQRLSCPGCSDPVPGLQVLCEASSSAASMSQQLLQIRGGAKALLCFVAWQLHFF